MILDKTNQFDIFVLIEFVRFKIRNDERQKRMTSEITGSTGSLKTSAKRQFFVR